MALDPLQKLIAEIALALPDARTLALAGGGPMIAHGYTDRSTRDIDLFTEIDDGEAIQVVVALRAALQEPRDHRFIAVDPHNDIEWLSCIRRISPPTRSSPSGHAPAPAITTMSPH